MLQVPSFVNRLLYANRIKGICASGSLVVNRLQYEQYTEKAEGNGAQGALVQNGLCDAWISLCLLQERIS